MLKAENYSKKQKNIFNSCKKSIQVETINENISLSFKKYRGLTKISIHEKMRENKSDLFVKHDQETANLIACPAKTV